MNTYSFNHDSFLPRHIQELQSSWSAEEMRQRAAMGRRKTQKLLRLVTTSVSEPELWAVGSIGPDDLLRLVG